MCILKNMLKRADLNNLIAYLADNTGSDEDQLEHCEKKLKESYETIFTKLEGMYPEADRQDDALFNTVTDFAEIHDNIYFEAGVLAGFQLYKSLDEGYRHNSLIKAGRKE